MTKAKTRPEPELSLAEQMAVFAAKGGKVQQIPDGVSAEAQLDRRGVVEMTARQQLGGRNGGKSKAANYASNKARKPKAASMIVIGSQEDEGDE